MTEHRLLLLWIEIFVKPASLATKINLLARFRPDW